MLNELPRIKLAITLSDIILIDSVLTPVIWDTVIYNRNVKTDLTDIIVPNNYNIAWISARLTYDNNINGSRLLRVYKNNNQMFPNESYHINAANGLGHTSIPYNTNAVEVTPGDKLRIIAMQNSGGPLSILAAYSSSFTVEFDTY